jgi:hypothetical protein
MTPYDDALSALRGNVGNLAAWLEIWEGRKEPDAHARRCASDAVAAIDAALGELYRVRAHLVADIRQADDASEARADALLARARDDEAGPRRRSR